MAKYPMAAVRMAAKRNVARGPKITDPAIPPGIGRGKRGLLQGKWKQDNQQSDQMGKRDAAWAEANQGFGKAKKVLGGQLKARGTGSISGTARKSFTTPQSRSTRFSPFRGVVQGSSSTRARGTKRR